MALQQFNKNENTFDASVDQSILIGVDAGFYGIQIEYKNFTPGANTGFKLSRTYSNNPQPSNIIEITDAGYLITDEDGVVVFKNGIVEVATFLVVDYTADSNAETSEFTITTNFRNS